MKEKFSSLKLSNVAIKMLRPYNRHNLKGFMQGILFVVGSVIFNVIGQFLLKSGVMKAGLNVISAMTVIKTIFTPLVLFGFVCYGISSIFWIMALSKNDLSFAYPLLLSLGLVLIVLISWVFLKEQMTLERIAGIMLVAIGVYFLFKSA